MYDYEVEQFDYCRKYCDKYMWLWCGTCFHFKHCPIHGFKPVENLASQFCLAYINNHDLERMKDEIYRIRAENARIVEENDEKR